MIIKDRLFENQTPDDMSSVINSKFASTSNLDSITRNYAKCMKYFVCFSSVSSGHGIISQSNYGWANSAMERICERRRFDGLPALAIQWGPIDDVGIWERIEDKSFVEIFGYKHQKVSSCLNVLDKFIQSQHSVLCSYEKKDDVVMRKKIENNTLEDKIMILLNVKNRHILSDDTTLGQLGVDSIIVIDLKKLFDEFGHKIEVQKIPELTLDYIERISKTQNTVS